MLHGAVLPCTAVARRVVQTAWHHSEEVARKRAVDFDEAVPPVRGRHVGPVQLGDRQGLYVLPDGPHEFDATTTATAIIYVEAESAEFRRRAGRGCGQRGLPVHGRADAVSAVSFQSVLTCPMCRHPKVESRPTDACQ